MKKTNEALRLILITAVITLLALFTCTKSKGQQISSKNIVINEIIHQNSDLDIVIQWDFFGINKVSCHNKINKTLKVEHTVNGNTLTSYIYPGSTIQLRRYDQCNGKMITCKYWKYQSPFGTGNTEWKYCGEFQFFVP